MATYLRNAFNTDDAIFQLDKTEDKKFYSMTNIIQDITLNAVSAVATATLLYSTPLNSQTVRLNNIIFNSSITMYNTAPGYRIFNLSGSGIYEPDNRLYCLVGISDQNLQAITTVTDFVTQNHISIPIKYASNQRYFAVKLSDDLYKLNSNRSFLNIFIRSTLSTADHANFVADVNAFIAARGGVSTLGSYQYHHNIFIAGRCH